jgi:hypothetical protein
MRMAVMDVRRVRMLVFGALVDNYNKGAKSYKQL